MFFEYINENYPNYNYSSQEPGTCGGVQGCCGEGSGKVFCDWCENITDVLDFVVQNNWEVSHKDVFFPHQGQMSCAYGNEYLINNICINPDTGCAYKGYGAVMLEDWVWNGCNIAWAPNGQNTPEECVDSGAYPGYGTDSFSGAAVIPNSDILYDWLVGLGLDISGANTWNDIINIFNEGGGSSGSTLITTQCAAGGVDPSGCGQWTCRCAVPGEDECEGQMGCMDPEACNYDPDATVPPDFNAGTFESDYSLSYYECQYIDDCGVCPEGGLNESAPNSTCTGCMDPEASNYCETCTIDFGDENAGVVGGSQSWNTPQECVYTPGCMDPSADNYCEECVSDDGSCQYSVYECQQGLPGPFGMTINTCGNSMVASNDPAFVQPILTNTPPDNINTFSNIWQCEDACGAGDLECWRCNQEGVPITTSVPLPFPLMDDIVYYMDDLNWGMEASEYIDYVFNAMDLSCPPNFEPSPIPPDACQGQEDIRDIPLPPGGDKEAWVCKEGLSQFCFELTPSVITNISNMDLPFELNVNELELNAFESEEECVNNSICKKGTNPDWIISQIDESTINRLKKLAGIKKLKK